MSEAECSLATFAHAQNKGAYKVKVLQDVLHNWPPLFLNASEQGIDANVALELTGSLLYPAMNWQHLSLLVSGLFCTVFQKYHLQHMLQSLWFAELEREWIEMYSGIRQCCSSSTVPVRLRMAGRTSVDSFPNTTHKKQTMGNGCGPSSWCVCSLSMACFAQNEDTERRETSSAFKNSTFLENLYKVVLVQGEIYPETPGVTTIWAQW